MVMLSLKTGPSGTAVVYYDGDDLTTTSKNFDQDLRVTGYTVLEFPLCFG